MGSIINFENKYTYSASTYKIYNRINSPCRRALTVYNTHIYMYAYVFACHSNQMEFRDDSKIFLRCFKLSNSNCRPKSTIHLRWSW